MHVLERKLWISNTISLKLVPRHWARLTPDLLYQLWLYISTNRSLFNDPIPIWFRVESTTWVTDHQVHYDSLSHNKSKLAKPFTHLIERNIYTPPCYLLQIIFIWCIRRRVFIKQTLYVLVAYLYIYIYIHKYIYIYIYTGVKLRMKM